jgi:transposase
VALEAALPAQVSRNPDLTLEEHRELFYDEHGVAVSVSSVSRAFGRLGLPLKKSPSRPQSATKRDGRSGARG